MHDEIVQGLDKKDKYIPSKYFYDSRGSRLFEQITQLEAYYPTRTENKILQTYFPSISQAIGPKAVLIELGSGSSKKTERLLEHLNNLIAYIPVDISEEYLLNSIGDLKKRYPNLYVHPIAADYTAAFDIPEIPKSYNRQVIFFPGSTIGNFAIEGAQSFLNNIYTLTENRAAMLVGVDLKKDKATLERAYNDPEGITAAFNKNILMHINRVLGANFDLHAFTHKAFYNEKEGRVEMHLVSKKKQEVTIGETTITFDQNESIHTENSYKYTTTEFEKLVNPWFEVKKVWTDEKKYFSVQFLEKK